MSPKGVAEFCRKWQPTHSWQFPTREGLARQLVNDVKGRPVEYVSELLEFTGTDPTYARGIVEGLSEAVKGEVTTIDWAAVFDFLEWIIAQDVVLGKRSGDPLDEDPHWGWAKRAVVDLIKEGCEHNALLHAFRGRMWSILQTMTENPDPTEADDEQSTMDAPTRSINTTRGRALHAVLQFACWERRAAGGAQKSATLPEDIRGVLEKHLNPDKESSPAVRAVYGQWLPSLFALDSEWTTAQLTNILPEASEHVHLRAVVWDTYLDFCNVYYDVFNILRAQYASAVQAVSKVDHNNRHQHNSDSRLGGHLMVLAAGGKIAWDDSDGLLRKFFINASDPIVEKALASFGHSLRRSKEPVAPEIIQRMAVFWGRIVDSVEKSREISSGPLKAFESWFGSGCFDATWSVDNLLRVLRLGVQLDAGLSVFEELERISTLNLPLAFSVIRELLMKDRTGWIVIGSRHQIRTVLTAALKDNELSESAKLLVHDLGMRGHFEFRDLLVLQAKS